MSGFKVWSKTPATTRQDEIIVEYASSLDEARRAVHAIEVNCGGIVEARQIGPSEWEIIRQVGL